jgi:predicted flap endonuclease-1-like 5' DNA nuclease
MANRTIAQVLKMHDELVGAIEARLEAAGKPKPVEKDYFITQKEERLADMKARLEEARQDREAVIERIDVQIAAHGKRIENLAKEIEQDRKNLDDRPVPDDPTPPNRPDRFSVRNIRGIGEVAEARLKENGITETTQLARMNKDRLAVMLGISEERAAEYIKAARLIL